MLQLEHTTEPRIQPTVSPHIVAHSALLELCYAELVSRIEQELAENPALDTDVDDEDYDPLPTGRPSTIYASNHSSPSKDSPSFDSLPAPWSLQDDLKWQFRAMAPASLHQAGEILITNIDDDGYLHLDVFELAEDLQVPWERVQRALEYVHQLSPPGVGARSLRECLRLQAQAKAANGEQVTEAVLRVINCFTGQYEDNVQQPLAAATGLPPHQVRHALEYIRDNLHPYPGRQFRSPLPPHAYKDYVYPDATIYYDGEDLQVDIPQAQSKSLCISHAYLQLEKAIKSGQQHDLSPDQAQQIEQQLKEARRFINMLQQRQQTMQRITAAIVDHQEGLILDGVMSLQPLTKKQIARQVGIHESTVSRATRQKYVMMPSGTLLPFDIFFQDSLPVKALIGHIIQQEDPTHPLTDKQLAQFLSDHGYRLARRTVTKYRQQMGIPSSRHRHK